MERILLERCFLVWRIKNELESVLVLKIEKGGFPVSGPLRGTAGQGGFSKFVVSLIKTLWYYKKNLITLEKIRKKFLF